MGLCKVCWNKKKTSCSLVKACMQIISILLQILVLAMAFSSFEAVSVQYAAHRMIQHMQPAIEQPQQVVRMWVVWVLNIHPGWHPLQAKMDYRSWLPTSCGSGLMLCTGNERKRKEVHSSEHWRQKRNAGIIFSATGKKIQEDCTDGWCLQFLCFAFMISK